MISTPAPGRWREVQQASAPMKTGVWRRRDRRIRTTDWSCRSGTFSQSSRPIVLPVDGRRSLRGSKVRSFCMNHLRHGRKRSCQKLLRSFHDLNSYTQDTPPIDQMSLSGFEPLTCRLEGDCSIRLSYRPEFLLASHHSGRRISSLEHVMTGPGVETPGYSILIEH